MSAIDAYMEACEPAERAALQHIRVLVHQFAPAATESMNYGMPGFKYNDKYFISFAAFKDHLSLFPASQVIELLGDALSGYTISKGTIQFTLDHPLSDTLLEEIIRTRLRLMA